jgi:hypothetical protein
MLKIIIERDKCIINFDFCKSIHLNRRSNIKFVCCCGIDTCKGFYRMFTNGGAFCKNCTNKNKQIKIKQTNLIKSYNEL